MKEQFKNLPQWSKGIIAVTVVAGIGLISYALYKKFNKSQQEKDAEESLKTVNKDIKDISKSQKQSYNSSQYASWADSLGEAMSGLGTDEKKIFDIFNKMKNTLDILLLIKAFGIREYTDDRVFVFNTKPTNLNQWIALELSESDVKELNKILSSKGIGFQF
jgi:hypothetical protein